MRRRGFVKACAVGMGCLGVSPQLLFASGEATPRYYETVRLVDHRGEPVRPAGVAPGRNHVFHYPYVATPCFLLNLGQRVAPRHGLRTQDGQTYDGPGGVGPENSLVAFSAICAHKMAHPTEQVSYIGFRKPGDGSNGGTITCCAENSVYDPYAGGEVVSGPAEQPLAAVLLEHDASEDALYVRGTLGGELFQRFFEEFQARLAVEYVNGEADARIRGDAEVVPMARFSDNIVRC